MELLIHSIIKYMELFFLFYLKHLYYLFILSTGERPPEYDIFLKTDDSNKPRRPLLNKDMFGPPSNSNQPSSSRKPPSTR